MRQIKPHSKVIGKKSTNDRKMSFNKIYLYFENMLFNPSKSYLVMFLLLPIELVLNLAIIFNVKYTEIDWVAYMQECEGFINGTLNYYELKGDTGPLVYPAGFVYIYTLFYAITNKGSNIRLAQYLFIGVYLVFISIIFFIFSKTRKVPPIALIAMSLTSHRIHSIFVLRLFNDPIAMLFLYASIACILKKWWRLGCILFSLAVSIKMNVLLFSPALAILLLIEHGLYGAIKHIILCAIIHLILGAPFIFSNPIAYIHRSFELSRQFFYKWTVNFKCVPEDIFLNRYFQLSLLFLHLFFLFILLKKILSHYFGSLDILKLHKNKVKLNTDFIISIMFASNFVGICFSRSLHYQFYVWYYHSFIYLLWITPYSSIFKLLILGLLELSWNTYPSTFYSSLLLHYCHYTVLFGMWKVFNDKNKSISEKE